MKRLCLACILLLTCAVVFSVEPPIVMIKLDDLSDVSPKWQRIVDFVIAEDIKANFGIIGSALEKEDKPFIAWVAQQKATGRFEFWNHGYAGFGHQNEFSGTGLDAQVKALKRSQELSKQRFGTAFAAFGPHSSQLDADTFLALAQVPEIALIWHNPPPAGSTTTAVVVERRVNMERPIFCPNPDAVKAQLEGKWKGCDYFTLMGHPYTWDDKKFADFQACVRYAKGLGCRFMLASEFVALRRAQPAVTGP